MMRKMPILVWDLPTRLFHWSLVLCVLAALATGLIGGSLIDWHARLGQAIVGLLAFRLVWGLIGSTYARFGQFFPTLQKIRAYQQGHWRGLGHNPLGALSVFGMLAVLLFQVGSGVLANDDIAFNGPLQTLVSKDLSDRLTGWHKLMSNGLIALIVLHVAAIAYYVRVKRENLVKPMITGYREAGDADGEPARGGGWLALLLALLIAGLAVYGTTGAWLPEPEPAIEGSPPAW